MIFLTISIKKLNKLINIDLKNLSNWLNANKIPLNVRKTETIIFIKACVCYFLSKFYFFTKW